MATDNEQKFLGWDGTEQLVATVKNLLDEKLDKGDAIASFNSYILNIDYDALLAFDTSEIVFSSNTTSVLGQAILGQMILA